MYAQARSPWLRRLYESRVLSARAGRVVIEGTNAGFGHKHVQRLVAWVPLHVIHLLARKGDTDGDDRMRCAQKFERAIVVTAAVPKAVSVRIESKQGNEHHIGRGGRPMRERLQNAEGATRHMLTGRRYMELKRLCLLVHTREADLAAFLHQSFSQQLWIGFVRERHE